MYKPCAIKIILVIVCGIGIIFINDNTFSPKNYSIVIEGNNLIAETEFANRIKIAANRLGWSAYVVNGSIDLDQGELKKVKKLNPDFIITPSAHNVNHSKTYGIKRYLFISGSGEEFFENIKGNDIIKLKQEYKNISIFDGFLRCIDDINLFEKYFKSQNLPFYNVQFYPYVQKIKANFSLKKFQTPKLIYSGLNWDPLRGSQKYKDFYYLISEQTYADFYGPYQAWKFLDKSYRGDIEVNGNSFIKTLSKYGVIMVLHSNFHLSKNIPSSRIFEAAASGAVIISDKNGFVKKHFGNKVLYIDNTKSAKEMFEQVNSHLEWIRNNPIEAQQLAKEANNIFLKHFTLENNLSKIAHMHEDIIQKEKFKKEHL